MDAGRCTAAIGSSRRIHTGASCCCSTSTFMATMAPGSAPAIRPVGPGSSPAACTCSPPPPASSTSNWAKRRRRRNWNRRAAAVRGGRRAIAGAEMAATDPALYQINTRVWLTALSAGLGRPATLDDIPDAELDHLAQLGFNWVWFLSVWQTGQASQRISRTIPELRREFQETLPDLREEDIAGSGFAITGYGVHENLGGDAALARLRERLRQHGLRLLLDFVPNHTGLDHPWVETHPEYYVHGSEIDLTRAPQNYTWVRRAQGDLLLAYGRDPYFPGWTDTLQLNYGNPATQEAMIAELVRIAGQCDSV